MIKIDRDSFPPDDKYLIGTNAGRQRWRCIENRVLLDFKNDPESFNNGTYKFPKHPSYNLWRDELLACQGHKCCYCEKSIDKGELEHFRPKMGYQQDTGQSLKYPGYYWLAYRWRNLFLSCGECNDKARKGNLFPISGERAASQRSNLINESCILVNPYDEEPAQFISFYKDAPIPVDNNSRGRNTIDIFQLDTRADLLEIRRDKLTIYKWASKLVKLKHLIPAEDQEEIKEAQILISKAKSKKDSFSGMIRENIKQGLI
jgi:uncharacterized protein (TIGR02646 family)